MAAFLAAGAATVTIYKFVAPTDYTASGTLRCTTGANVVQVYVVSTEGDRAVGNVEPVSNATEVTSAAAMFSYHLPNGGSYRLHVGCGDTAGQWATANYSVLLHGLDVSVGCNDPPPAAATTAGRHGHQDGRQPARM